MRQIFSGLAIWSLMILAGALAACGGGASPTAVPTATQAAQAGAPIVIINSPASNSDFEPGAQVQINSTSTAASGIVLVELVVDGRVVQSSPTPNAQPQTRYSVIQTWRAEAGDHTITVRATDARAATGDASIIVNVSGAAQPTTAIQTLVPPPTLPPTTVPETPTPSPATAIPPPPTCTLSSLFISDVTFPDGTQIAPNSPFVKTWRMQNNGSCAWGAGFSIVFISGSRMAAPSPSPIPAAAPGATVDVSLNMIAPAQPGTYSGVWQLQASNGALFGQRVSVKIVVPGSVTPIPPTPPPPACSGTPGIASFTANPSTIQPGQIATLSWGPVTNYNNVVLQSPQGNSGVGPQGQIQVQPGGTTTYTLVAYCYNVTSQAQTTVTVQNAPPTPTPPPSNPNQIQEIQVEKSGDNYKVTVKYYWNGDEAPATMRGVGVNSSADPVTNYGQQSIIAGFVKYVILNLTGKGAVTIDVCMLGHSGQELACGSQAVK